MAVTKIQTSDNDCYEDRGAIVTLSFDATGTDNMASTTVTGLPWVSADSRIVATLVGSSTRSIEEALIEGVRIGINSIVNGVGFDVFAHAPNGAQGDFTVHVVGV